MGQPQRVSTEQIVAAYMRTGSVWEAGKQLGIVGQSVWERLRAIGHPMRRSKWTRAELDELQALVAAGVAAAEIALRLGRPFAGVACKMNELGLYTRKGRKLVPVVPRGSGLTKMVVDRFVKEIAATPDLSLRAYSRRQGISVDLLAAAIQKYQPRVWDAISRSRGLNTKDCPNCGRQFYPMTAKQATCTRKCSSAMLRDKSYFGGKRKNTIGLTEGVCQLCQRETKKGLSSHHVFGKENDPDNDTLIALCPGCHGLVGALGSRKFVDDEAALQRLIELAIWRKNGSRKAEFHGTHVNVDVEYLTAEDAADLGESDD